MVGALGYKLKKQRHGATISHFLTGHAYEFYVTTVSQNARSWTKETIFIEMFNYCFPVDFRMRQRDKLRRSYQRGRTVREYVHELDNLFLMAGVWSEREKVDKLWTGLQPYIQKGLWKDKLTPMHSSYTEIREAAEIIEIAENIGQPSRNNRADEGPQGGGLDRPQRGPNRREKRKASRDGQRRPKDSPPRASGSGSTAPAASGSRTHSAPSRRPQQKGSQRRTQLTNEERKQLSAEGKCFICRETGHISRNCPKNTVKGNRTSAPGVPTYNIDIDLGEVNALHDIAESTARIDELELSCMLFEVDDEDLDDLPELQMVSDLSSDEDSEYDEPRVTDRGGCSSCPHADNIHEETDCISGMEDVLVSTLAADMLSDLPLTVNGKRKRMTIGDLYGARARDVLRQAAPYCCNGTAAQVPANQHYDFLVYEVAPMDEGQSRIHWIMNPYTLKDTYIESSKLRDPAFDLPAWFRMQVAFERQHVDCCATRPSNSMGDALVIKVEELLNEYILWPNLGTDESAHCQPRFECLSGEECVEIYDTYLWIVSTIPTRSLENGWFDVVHFYAKMAYRRVLGPVFGLDDLEGELIGLFRDSVPIVELNSIEVNSNRVDRNASGPSALPALQRNAAVPRDFQRLIPEPAIVVIQINGQPARTLLDSGSMADFLSARFAHQIGVKTFELARPLPVHLAVQGSRAKINLGCKARLSYQAISDVERYFDIVNLLNYDVILGTPFMFQHQITLGLNPTTVEIGSAVARPLEGKRLRVLESRAAEVLDDRLEQVREQLHALREAWIEKRDAYLKSGRWQMSSARNTCPMLLLKKPGTGTKGVPPKLRCVVDVRERNANTEKLTSPLPDMDSILRHAASHPFLSLVDGKDAYDQIRVEPDHVERTAMTTPDGNMVSLVMQQGDCNAVATYQSLMNYLFGPYIGRFLDVYLDDIVIYSKTLQEHVEHVKIVVDILRKEKLYLGADKLKFLCKELKLLGRIIVNGGIQMDPDKVDSVVNWKVPTNRELLRGFLGSVGYLADDIATIRIPMGILTSLTGLDASYKWDFTHQRAFEEIKRLVQAHRDHRRIPLDYSSEAQPIWLVTDGSHGGIAGVVSQGPNFREAHVAAFYLAKLSSAQMNYPVHEIEMLAGVESMRRHREILLGCHFTWLTDHKGLVHLTKQRNLSGRQARWLEKMAEFDFEVQYVPGVDNVLADALSRIYAHDAPGTVRAASEYAQYDEDESFSTHLAAAAISMPVFAGLEALAV
ncbi:hypothetical protein EVJ58_g4727, partial [Rhodofomes roseus]